MCIVDECVIWIIYSGNVRNYVKFIRNEWDKVNNGLVSFCVFD